MKIDITKQPDSDIFRDRKKYILWFCFFMFLVGIAIAIGVFAVYYDTSHYENIDNYALGILALASLGVTWSGNKLQSYKKLFPPQFEKLTELRAKHPVIETYCAKVQASGRRFIRAEYEACVDYSEKHAAVPFI